MILGEVLGRVWAERQHTGLDGRRLVLVRDLASDARHVAVAVAGDLATVEEAVEIGEEVARAISGRAVKSIVFASPCAPVGALADDLALVGS